MVHAQRDRGGGSLRLPTSRAWRAGAGVLLALAWCITWALGIARYGGPDEPAHVLRAYAVAHGEWVGEQPDGTELAPGYRIVTAPASLASGDPACFRHDSTITPDCAVPSTSTAPIRVATSAGINPPLYYAVVGSIARLFGTGATRPGIYRIVAACLNALVLGLAAWRLRPAGFIALAAFSPAAWFLLSVVNPNGFELVLASLAWVGVLRWTQGHRTPGAALWVSVPMAIAVAARPISLVETVAMVAVAAVLGGRTRPGTPRPWRMRLAWALPLAAAIASVALWQAVLGAAYVHDPRTAEQVLFLTAVRRSFAIVPLNARELVGSLGWREYWAPPVAQLLWLAVGVVLVGLALRRGTLPKRWWWAVTAWAVALVLAPVAFDVVFFTTIGPIWQGRYSLPVWVGVAMLLSAAAPRLSRRSVTPMGAALACAEVITFWAVVRRSTVGTNGSWWFTDAVSVGAPHHPLVLVSVHIALVALLGYSMYPNTSMMTAVEPVALNTPSEPPPSLR